MAISSPKTDSIFKLIESAAKVFKQNPAILNIQTTPVTYDELYQIISDFSAFIKERKLFKDDKIAIVLPNGPEMALMFLATCANAIAAPLNNDYKQAEFEFYIKDLQPKLIILAKGIDSPARIVASSLSIPIFEIEIGLGSPLVAFKELRKNSPEFRHEAMFPSNNDIAIVMHTSGTTSTPKKVQLSQRNLIASIQNITQTLQLSNQDCFLNVMPLFHVYGLMAVTATISKGGKAICTSGFVPEKFFEWYQTAKPTWYAGGPAVHHSILSIANQYKSTIEQSPLRFIRSASAPLPVSTIERLEQVFKAPVIESYGMTESCSQMTSNPIPPGVRKVGSVGKVVFPGQIAIVDDDGINVKQMTIGEILMKGPNVSPGYENDDAATQSSFNCEWLKSGDLGYLDADGYLFIVGRKKELINRGGEKISPTEVDKLLVLHPAVFQAAAFAIPHLSLGEEVAAAVVLKEGCNASSKEIYEFLETRLSEFKVPKKIIFVDALPKSATGKIQRSKILDLYREKFFDDIIIPSTADELKVAEIWATALNIPLTAVGVNSNFYLLGGDSLQLVTMLRRVNYFLKCSIGTNTLNQNPTIRQILEISKATLVQNRLTANPSPNVLSPFAQVIQLLSANPNHPETLVICRVLESNSKIDPNSVRTVAERLVNRHDALRSVFRFSADKWVQETLEGPVQIPVSILDISEYPQGDLENELQQKLKILFNQVGQQFLACTPAIQFVVVNLGFEKPQGLLMVFHHAIMDGYSSVVLSEEFESEYLKLATSPLQPAPVPSTISHFEFSELQYKALKIVGKKFKYWTEPLEESPRPIAPSIATGSVYIIKYFKRALSEAETKKLIVEKAKNFNCSVRELLLTLTLHFNADLTESDVIILNLVESGRLNFPIEVDLTSLIGNLAFTVPIAFKVDRKASWKKQVASVIQQSNEIPSGGWPYVLCKYLETKLHAGYAPWGEKNVYRDFIHFNYLGNGKTNTARPHSGPFLKTYERELSGLRVMGQAGDWSRNLMLRMLIWNDQFTINFLYNETLFTESKISNMTEKFLSTLASIKI